MPKQVLADLDFVSVSRFLNLPDATTDQEPATLAQVRAAIEGLSWKDSVRVKTQGNINLAAPGASVDGVSMVVGDRFLAGSQSTLSQNGIYIWNGAATAATRALDANTFAELEQAVTTVEEGTDAGTTWRQTAVNGTLDSSNVTWVAFGTAAPAATETVPGITEKATQAEVDAGTPGNFFVAPETLAAWAGRTQRFTANIGDGSNTSFTVTHNFGTRDLQVVVYRNSGNYDQVECEVRHTSTTQVQLIFSVAPTSNQFRAVILA